jgi:hypothetical protein
MIKSVTHQHIATGVMSRSLVWCLENPEEGREDILGLGSPYSIARAFCLVCTNGGQDPGAKDASPSRMCGRRPAVGVNQEEWATPSKFRPPSPAPCMGRYGGGDGPGTSIAVLRKARFCDPSLPCAYIAWQTARQQRSCQLAMRRG